MAMGRDDWAYREDDEQVHLQYSTPSSVDDGRAVIECSRSSSESEMGDSFEESFLQFVGVESEYEHGAVESTDQQMLLFMRDG